MYVTFGLRKYNSVHCQLSYMAYNLNATIDSPECEDVEDTIHYLQVCSLDIHQISQGFQYLTSVPVFHSLQTVLNIFTCIKCTDCIGSNKSDYIR